MVSTEIAPSSCPLCGDTGISGAVGTHADEGTIYRLYHCRTCEIQFWWPLKNPGSEWYSKHARYGARNRDPIWAANWNQRKVLSFLAPLKGALLDVGCGIGNFLALAKEQGWQCSGVDFDPDAIDAARKRTGLSDLSASDVLEYARKNPGKKFDLITFFDVLEHVDNHNEFIETISGLAKDGGYVAMSMPYRKRAPWLMPGDVPPVHLTKWDRTSLRRFLHRHGFDVVYMTRRSEGVWNIVMKLRFRFGGMTSFGVVQAVREKVGDIGAPTPKRPVAVKLVQFAAKAKDALLFGVPALAIWLVMLPMQSRYATLYAIAQKRHA